jgi:hypothetical protein
MTSVKSKCIVIAITFISLAILKILFWQPRVNKIPVIYPDYGTYYIGESLSMIKNKLGDRIYEADNDGGRQNCRYFVFNDTSANSNVNIYSLLTFYKNHLVSFYSQFQSKDSTYNLSTWLKIKYRETINSSSIRCYTQDGKSNYKLIKDNTYIHLAIDKEYSRFSKSTYLVGDYRYKEIDWDEE